MDLLQLMIDRNIDGRTLQRRSRLPATLIKGLASQTAAKLRAGEVMPLARALGMSAVDLVILLDVDDQKGLDWQEQGFFETMGSKISAVREATPFSQSALATHIGRSAGWMSQIETDRIQCLPHVLVAIARALDVDPKSLVPRGLKKTYNVQIDNFLVREQQEVALSLGAIKLCNKQQNGPLLTTIPGRILAARKAAGLTQMDVASRTRMSQPAIVLLETNTLRPSWETIVKVATAIGAKPLSLIPPGEQHHYAKQAD